MTISTATNSNVAQLNSADLNTLAMHLRNLQAGSILRAIHTTLRGKAPLAVGASPYDLATLQAFALPDDAKALNISRAYARAGTGTKGELAVQAFGTTPTGAQIAVAPSGNIVLLGTDAYTSVDIVYHPEKSLTVEFTLPVVTSILTLPTTILPSALAVSLFEVEALVGTTAGKKIILVPSDSAPSTTYANFNLAKTRVLFATADAVTSARVKYSIASAVDVDAYLEAASQLP